MSAATFVRPLMLDARRARLIAKKEAKIAQRIADGGFGRRCLLRRNEIPRLKLPEEIRSNATKGLILLREQPHLLVAGRPGALKNALYVRRPERVTKILDEL